MPQYFSLRKKMDIKMDNKTIDQTICPSVRRHLLRCHMYKI